MEVKQIYSLMNDVTKEILGETAIVSEDLSNVVDIGTALFDATSVDNYVKSLVNHIGKVIFVNRPYSGNIPNVLMDSWEFGSVLEKISADIPEAEENESWELVDRTSYDPNVFYKPTATAKFYNKSVTFEVPMSFTEMQVKESFSNAGQLNAFISMLYNAVDKSMTIKVDSLIMRTIDNMIGETLYADVPAGNYSAVSGVKAVNLLKLFNDRFGTELTAANCITNADFIRFASYTIGVYMSRLSKISTLFNIGGKERFTPSDYLNVVMISDFAKSADAYLQSDVYHNEYTALAGGKGVSIVPYWQGSGLSYAWNDISTINITTASGHEITSPSILAVMFDKDALGVTNEDRRVTTNYNPKAEFFSNWTKFKCSYFNDTNENFVVFYVA